MVVLVVGANGQIGRKLVGRLDLREGVRARAMIRSEGQREALQALGAEVVLGDLEGEFEHALDGVHAVVFTAGSGAKTGLDKTLMVDLWGARRVIDACVDKGVKRFVMVSTIGAPDPLAGPASLRPYLVAKRAADDHLLAAGLDHTILRPARLTDEEGTGKVTTTRTGAWGEVTRADTAHALELCAVDGLASHGVVELYQGETPVAEALGG